MFIETVNVNNCITIIKYRKHTEYSLKKVFIQICGVAYSQ